MNRLQPVRLVSFVTTDLAGITRGRSLPLATLEEQLASGCGWVPANRLADPQDLIDESSPWGSHGDLRLLPDPNSRVRVEQGPDAAAPALDYLHGNLVETDGTPWPACPRSLLRAEVERYRDSGLQVIAAFEHEFSLLGLPGERPAAAFSLQAQRAAGQFPGWLVSALAQAGTEPEMFLPEYGQRQYEVTCRPAQGVAAADRAVNVREVTREVARQMGLRTCFAPLPAPGAVTNGVHLHLSLQHADGSPLLYEPGRPNDLSELGEHWAAGVLAHLPALCALTAPTAASYLRLKPHHWSAAYACLGLRNREAALRICPVVSVGGKPLGKQYNLEFRPMDATACPHLAMAAVLIAGRLGIERRLPLRALADIDPHGLSDEERQARGIQALPATLGDALDCLQRDEALCAGCKAAAGHLPRHEAPRTGADGGPFRRRPVPPLCRALLTTPNSASTSCRPTTCSIPKGAARWSWSASMPAGTFRWSCSASAWTRPRRKNTSPGISAPWRWPKSFPGDSTRHCWRPATRVC